MNRGSRLVQAISDRTNPVVVKELRQAVQSRLVIAMLLLFLLVNVMIVSGYLMLSIDATTSERAGQDLFGVLFVVLVTTCAIFVPLYAAVRLTMERNDSNIDLLFITTIAPAAIIRGKFWSAVALTALIYSASIPFLTLTYLLRGIDLPSIFFALGIAFLCTAITITLGIFVGSVAGGLLLRILMIGGLVWVGGWTMIYSILVGLSIAQMGLASMFASSETWTVCGMWVLLGLGAWGLLYLLAVAAVSARSSNRMFPVRVFVTVFWLVLGLAIGIWNLVHKADEIVMVWVVANVALFSVTMSFILAERESWTPRVRRHIPRGRPLRFLAWLFYTGSAGGVIWCFALSVATLLAGFAMVGTFTHSTYTRDTEYVPQIMFGVLLFAWCYSMSGLLLRRIFVPKSVPLVGTAIGLLLLGIAGTLPLLGAYFVLGPNWQFESLPIVFVIVNPFVLGRTGADQVIVFAFLGIWAIFGLLANFSWFRQQWQAFRHYDPKPVDLPAPVAEEPPVVHV